MRQISIWEKESFFAHQDVIIVGSGLVGLWCAYFLKQKHPHWKVTIVERGIIPTGASTRNAGFACFGSVTELLSDQAKFGEDKMLEIVAMRWKGIKRIRKVFSDRRIGFEHNGGYELIGREQLIDIDSLRSKMDGLNHKIKKITKQPKAFRLQDALIRKFGFAGTEHLVENIYEGQLHSGKLCMALLHLVQSLGVNILNCLEIKHFEKINRRLQFQTNHSIALSAEQLLICTNGFAQELLPQTEVQPARGQVLVTGPLPNIPFKGTFHFDNGFYYFRDLNNRVLLGGARNKAFDQENTADLSTTDFIQHELEHFLSAVILPSVPFRIDYRWGGIMGVGEDKSPIVKKISENIFCAVRMGGMGVALAPVIGENIAALMTG